MHFINEDLKKAIQDFEETIAKVNAKVEALKEQKQDSVKKIEEAIEIISNFENEK